jgi:hypothetical protein
MGAKIGQPAEWFTAKTLAIITSPPMIPTPMIVVRR